MRGAPAIAVVPDKDKRRPEASRRNLFEQRPPFISQGDVAPLSSFGDLDYERPSLGVKIIVADAGQFAVTAAGQ